MGTWGTQLFESDAACDVRDTFAELIPKGTSVEGCVGHVIRWHLAGRRATTDQDDRMERDWLMQEADLDTILALAWCVQDFRMRQPGAGRLMRAVLSRASQISAEGTGLDGWPPEHRDARRRLYDQLARRLVQG